MDEQIYELEIDLLQPNPLQPRGLISPESLSELAESVRIHGVLEPLVVAKTPAGYQIIAGERRWRASKVVGLPKVPVIIRETSPQGMLEMAIVENVQRIDLNPLERAQAYARLMGEFGLANAEIAERVSKSPSYISNTIKLLTLPDALKDALKRSLSVRGTEELVRKFRVRQGIGPKKGADVISMHIVSDEIDKVQNDLLAALSKRADKTQVKCTQTGKRVKVEMLIEGEPAHTSQILEYLRQAIVGYFN